MGASMMKAGDYIESVELIHDSESRYHLLLEVEDGVTGEISHTRINGNETILDLSINGIRNSKIEAMAIHPKSNVVHIEFDNGYQTISWRCSNCSGDFRILG